jgi:hypothetical protein
MTMTVEVSLNSVFKRSLMNLEEATVANCWKLGPKNGSKKFVRDMESGDNPTRS